MGTIQVGIYARNLKRKETTMRHQGKRYVWVIGLVLALPLLVLAAALVSSDGEKGEFKWFTVGTKTNTTVVENTIAYGVNEDGKVVGTYENQAGDEHGFYTKDKGEHIYAINKPGACNTEVTAINDEGVIGGIYEKNPGCVDHLFLKEGDDFDTIELPTKAEFKSPKKVCTDAGGKFDDGECEVKVDHYPDLRGISYDGDIVGGFSPQVSPYPDYGFVTTEGEFRVLEVCTQSPLKRTTGASIGAEGCHPGTTDGWGINDDYVVVGHYEDMVPFCEFDPEDGTVCETHHHGFIWTKKHGFKALYCDGDPGSNTDANAINDDGVIVGRCDSKAFVLLPPYGDSDWTTFTFPSCPDTTWTLGATVAWGISNEDKIVGSFTCENSGDKTYSFEVKLKDIVKE